METAVLAVLCFFPIKSGEGSFDVGFKNRNATRVFVPNVTGQDQMAFWIYVN